MGTVRKLATLTSGLTVQAAPVLAHTTGPDHYHAPGPLDLSGMDLVVVAGVLVFNIAAWLLVLYAVQRYRDGEDD